MVLSYFMINLLVEIESDELKSLRERDQAMSSAS